MKYKIVAVRDRVADVFSNPFFVASTGAAIRSFGDEVNNKREGNQYAAHPEDFDLFYVGEYDDADASFDVVRPQQIAVGKDLVR